MFAAIDVTQIVVSVVAAAGSVTIAGFGFRQHWADKKEALRVASYDRSDRLIDQLQEQVATEQARRQRLDDEIGQKEFLLRREQRRHYRCWLGALRLIHQIESMNAQPVWRPVDNGFDADDEMSEE